MSDLAEFKLLGRRMAYNHLHLSLTDEDHKPTNT